MRPIVIALLLTGSVLAQDAEEAPAPGPWNLRFDLGLNFTQSSFSENWNGDEKGSWNWILNGDLKASRRITEHFQNDNQLQMAYGQTSTQVQSGGERKWTRPDKTTDLIQFESTGRWEYGFWLEPYVAFRLDSVFRGDSGSALDPYKLTESGGVAHSFWQTEQRELISRLGFGFRQAARRSGGERSVNTDGGFEFQTQAIQPLFDGDVVYTGKFLLFWPVFYGESDALEEYDLIASGVDPNHESIADFWKSPDINWQNTFTAQVTNIISVNLYVQFIYDKYDEATKIDPSLPTDELISGVQSGVRKAGQFKQTLALGITYRLF